MTYQSTIKRIEKVSAEAKRKGKRIYSEPALDGREHPKSKVRDVLYWLQNHTKTKEPHWRDVGASTPFRPFPDKPYFAPILDALRRESVLFIAKSRDLMMSWLVVSFFIHDCMTNTGVEVLFQSQTEEKAGELIDYAKCLYGMQDIDIQEQYPLAESLERQSRLELRFANGSRYRRYSARSGQDSFLSPDRAVH